MLTGAAEGVATPVALQVCRRRGEGWQSACDLLLNHQVSLFKADQSGLTDHRVSFPACVMEACYIIIIVIILLFSKSKKKPGVRKITPRNILQSKRCVSPLKTV